MPEFQKYPGIALSFAADVSVGWDSICRELRLAIDRIASPRKTVVVELYQGVHETEVTKEVVKRLHPELLVTAGSCYKDAGVIRDMVHPDVTDDRIFGYLTRLTIDAFFDQGKLSTARMQIASRTQGLILIIGTGAAIIPPAYDLLVYADMARWEIQQRMRRHLVGNIGADNRDTEDWMLLYKQGYFVDWRVCDRLKRSIMRKWDYVLDTNGPSVPKLVSGAAVLAGFDEALRRPFSVVPFFDPGPWGGQWMTKVCGLDPEAKNYAWCFNCVPEENSVLLGFGGTQIELPSVDLVFYNPRALLGPAVYARFGDEFPIRFDFLDTMDGGNLSLQVHPLTEYIQEKFGMHYTQDESYYLMEAKEGAVVYLGLRDGVDPPRMLKELEEAQRGGTPFDAEKHVQTWPVKKHDHLLIPGGTVHCSGKDSVVLEISATPYIFTFKLWDWGRVGLDGRPRPINIEHGKNTIQWDRTASWTRANLVNRIEKIAEGEGWREERTGLHEREFIETRRHWFAKPVSHSTGGGVNVLCLVEGKAVTIESPARAFEPFTLHYAETCIVPACVGDYLVRPLHRGDGDRCATIKAFVRSRA